MIADASCHTHGAHESTLLPPPVDDGQQDHIVQDDVPAAPSRHVEVLVQDRLADVLLGYFTRQNVTIEKLRRQSVTFYQTIS